MHSNGRNQKQPKLTDLKVLLLVGLMVLLSAPAAWAVGTASGTDIDNQAQIAYQVGGVDQTPIASDGDSGTPGIQVTRFVVDNLVDISVQTLDADAVTVAPGASVQVLRFQVNNEGNTTQDFLLTAVEMANGTYTMPFPPTNDEMDDNFNGVDLGPPVVPNVRIFVDADGASSTLGPPVYTPSTWDDETTESEMNYIDELPADNSITVYIVTDIDLGQVDGDEAVYAMRAQVAVGGTAGAAGAAIASDDSGTADVADTVEIVFGDDTGSDDPTGNNDGYHSSRSGYIVASATLAVDKTSAVQEDPVNGTSNQKAIPGARVRYTIDITNSGSTDATSVQVVDQIPDNTDFYLGSVTASANQAGFTVDYSDTAPPGPLVWGFAPVDQGDGADDDVTYIRVTLPNDILTAAGAPDDTAQVVFDVLVE